MSWWLENADARHAEAPRSFFIPPLEHRQDLAPGRLVKLVFAFEPPRRGHSGERMWVEVTERQADGTFTGTLANDPSALTELAFGDSVTFGPEHVVAIQYRFDELGYEPGDAVVVDPRILREDRAPAVLDYAQPRGEDHWFWFAGLEHGPPAETDVSTLGDLTDRWPELEIVFRSAGGSWVRDGDGYREVD